MYDINKEIQQLEQGKYLGPQKSKRTDQQMERSLKDDYTRILTIILKSELNAKNRIRATGAIAVPVLRYSFGIPKYTKKIREENYKDNNYKMHDTKTDIDRIYVQRKEGRGGLLQI
jgi:hypothetical protein